MISCADCGQSLILLRTGDTSRNTIDLMQLKPHWRDAFPKMDLHKGYVGDGYPLCVHLPQRPFLRRGARYRFLGYSDVPATSATVDVLVKPPGLLTLEDSSELYAELAATCKIAKGAAHCFKGEVELVTNLACVGAECRVSTLGVVVVNAHGKTVHYEYVPVACVELAFYNEGALVGESQGANELQCADKRTDAAGAACCSGDDDQPYSQCEYFAEALPFQLALDRCDAASVPGSHRTLCPLHTNLVIGPSGTTTDNCGYPGGNSDMMVWMKSPCRPQVQVRVGGRVSIVHEGTSRRHLDLDSKVPFRVRWERGLYPTAQGGCTAGCYIHMDTCVCNVTVHTTRVFWQDDELPTSNEADERLRVGSAPPDSFDSGAYIQCVSTACMATDVEVWVRASSGVVDEDTIFKVVRNSSFPLYLANMQSTVVLGDSVYHFRNPPQFMSHVPARVAARDAAYEVEALLDHLFTHTNTPPFIARALIKKMTVSNPTPRLVRAVAQAFSNGTCTVAPGVGSGKYGQLGAAVACLLLDREARSVTVESDPAHGMLREPVLKVMQFMRAMEYSSFNSNEVC